MTKKYLSEVKSDAKLFAACAEIIYRELRNAGFTVDQAMDLLKILITQSCALRSSQNE